MTTDSTTRQSLIPAAPSVEIALFDEAQIRAAIDELAALLVDSVDGGASVGFNAPLDIQTAHAFWESVAAYAAAGTRVVLVAREGGRVVGTVQLGPATMPSQRHRADVLKLLVHPSARRRGIGRGLMMRLEDEARVRGRTLLTLDTRHGDAAQALYVSLGFTFVGIIPNYAGKSPDELHATAIFYKQLRASRP